MKINFKDRKRMKELETLNNMYYQGLKKNTVTLRPLDEASATLVLENKYIEQLLNNYAIPQGITCVQDRGLLEDDITMYLFEEDKAKITVQYDYVIVNIGRIKRTFNFPKEIVKAIYCSDTDNKIEYKN